MTITRGVAGVVMIRCAASDLAQVQGIGRWQDAQGN
jgi:hypothetical protein